MSFFFCCKINKKINDINIITAVKINLQFFLRQHKIFPTINTLNPITSSKYSSLYPCILFHTFQKKKKKKERKKEKTIRSRLHKKNYPFPSDLR